MQRHTGDVLDPLHELDESFVILWNDRCEADPAVPCDDGGHSVPTRWRELLVPGGLTVVVGVDVDETGKYQVPISVDLALAAPVDPTHLRDDPARHGDVGDPRRSTATVDHGPAPDD
jgi:hypothetical protein